MPRGRKLSSISQEQEAQNRHESAVDMRIHLYFRNVFFLHILEASKNQLKLACDPKAGNHWPAG